MSKELPAFAAALKRISTARLQIESCGDLIEAAQKEIASIQAACNHPETEHMDGFPMGSIVCSYCKAWLHYD